MISFINFIFESGISLGIFTILYLLLLQRETLFRTNRYFLIFALLFSLVLPFIRLGVYDPQPVMLAEVTVTPYRNLLETVSVYGSSLSDSIALSISTSTYLVLLYLAGVVFFSVRFLMRVAQIILLIRRNKIVDRNGIKLVILEKATSLFSFLSYVFVGSICL